MNLLTNDNALDLWHDTIKHAEDICAITLQKELESYLISLLIHYMAKPEILHQVIATTFLDSKSNHSNTGLQQVGDQCLLLAGLFPQSAEKKLVKISYFVDLGRSAYTSISGDTHELFRTLAFQFVHLMDVLQSIRPHPDLLPLIAYEQWKEVGSQRAFRLLQEYSRRGALPIIRS